MHEFEEVNGTDSMAEFRPSRPVSEMQQLLLSNERKLAETNKAKAPEKTEGEKPAAGAGDKLLEDENSEQKPETESGKTAAEKPDGSEEGSERKKSSSTEEVSTELGGETSERVKTDADLAANGDVQPMEVDVGGTKEIVRGEVDDKIQTSLEEAADSETAKDNRGKKDIAEERQKSGTAAEIEERTTEDKIDEDNGVKSDPACPKEAVVTMETVGERDEGLEAAKEEEEQGKETEVKSKAGDEVKSAEEGEKEGKEPESNQAKNDDSASAKAGKPKCHSLLCKIIFFISLTK